MKEILRERGINPSIIQDKIKDKKEKKGMSFDNHKAVCEVLNINRTSTYSSYKPSRIQIDPRKYIDANLIYRMYKMVVASDFTIGRDKLYVTYNNELPCTSSYKWRINWELLGYTSKAYIRRKDGKPTEAKYKEVNCDDLIDFNYKSEYPNQKWFADISYAKILGVWFFLHVITETYSNRIVA